MKFKTSLPLALSWSSLFLLTFLIAYLYIFNEWLFAVTKPSYMSNLSFIRQLQVYLTTSALLTSLCFFALLPLLALGMYPALNRYSNFLIQLGGLLPSVISAALILIMIDNFTYTLFRFGIVLTEGWSRGLYGAGFVVIFIVCYVKMLKTMVKLSLQIKAWRIPLNRIFSLLLTVLFLSIAVLIFQRQMGTISLLSISKEDGEERRPHILLITSDGVNADNMSAYGYVRETTPNLSQLAEASLVAENAYSNSGKTTGSVISIYTGKYPAKTRLIASYNILRGADSYEHLLGILRSVGYKTVQITVPLYLDAYDLNLMNGFDKVITGRGGHSQYLKLMKKILPNDNALFADDTANRIIDRIRHILFIERMTNPYREVTKWSQRYSDSERLEALGHEIQTAQQPLFVHVHLMGTHGPMFYPAEQFFSANQPAESQEIWNVDFYDDSILEFDKEIGDLVNQLREDGLLDNTILIIGSDHGQEWNQLQRVPLIIHFPNEEYVGRTQVNVQNLDIAPTILDYIGLDQPDWMDGTSLIDGELEQRPIFGVSAINPDEISIVNNTDGEAKVISSIDNFRNISLIYCQKWFKLDFTKTSWESGIIEGSTTTCSPSSEINDEQAFQQIVTHLQKYDFDVSRLSHLSHP